MQRKSHNRGSAPDISRGGQNTEGTLRRNSADSRFNNPYDSKPITGKGYYDPKASNVLDNKARYTSKPNKVPSSFKTSHLRELQSRNDNIHAAHRNNMQKYAIPQNNLPRNVRPSSRMRGLARSFGIIVF